MRARIAVGSVALAAAVLASGCSGDGRAAHPDASGLFTCRSNADCDDRTPCTVDNCDVSGVCQHNPIDSMCPGQHCVTGVGCTSVTTCTDSSMCDDAIACTVDSCNVGNVCGHQTVDSLCSDPTPVCDATLGCVAGTPVGCSSSAECDDTVACTVDSCGVDTMCHHMALDSLCGASERCDAAMGCVMVHGCTTAADCMDPAFWNFCDGTPICSPEFGCMFPTPRMCDDGNACTMDGCDRTAGVNGACTTACDRTVSGCDSDPACATVAPTCSGMFSISPSISTSCAFGMVNYNFNTVSIDAFPGMLVVTPGSTATFGALTDGAAPVCPSFDARASVLPAGGGVSEYYSLTGDFTDSDHFTATWTQHYVGLGHGVCPEQSYVVTGTRM